MSLAFIGLGLNDEKGMTLEGLEEARRADSVYGEFYTNIMPNLDLKRLEKEIGKKVEVLSRSQLEDEGGEKLLRAASRERVAFLVPGDPLIATTHVSLRLSLAKMAIPSRVIHVPRDQPLPKSVLDTISDNNDRGLHTLILLDVQVRKTSQMTIRDAITRITTADPRLETCLTVGVANLGSRDERVKASRMNALIGEDFGNGPQSIIVVGRLHFMEAEALELLCGASHEDLRELS